MGVYGHLDHEFVWHRGARAVSGGAAIDADPSLRFGEAAAGLVHHRAELTHRFDSARPPRVPFTTDHEALQSLPSRSPVGESSTGSGRIRVAPAEPLHLRDAAHSASAVSGQH